MANRAAFTINGTPSTDPITGDRGYSASSSEVLNLTLEQNPAPDVISTTFSVYDPNDPESPLATKDAPLLTFGGGNPSETPADKNGTVQLTFPAAGLHTYILRSKVLLKDQTTEVFERAVARLAAGSNAWKPLPGESNQFSQRTWADSLAALVDFVSGGGIPSHSALSDLGADDHPHYLLADGSRALSGDLDVGGNNVTNVALVDGVDVADLDLQVTTPLVTEVDDTTILTGGASGRRRHIVNVDTSAGTWDETKTLALPQSSETQPGDRVTVVDKGGQSLFENKAIQVVAIVANINEGGGVFFWRGAPGTAVTFEAETPTQWRVVQDTNRLQDQTPLAIMALNDTALWNAINICQSGAHTVAMPSNPNGFDNGRRVLFYLAPGATLTLSSAAGIDGRTSYVVGATAVTLEFLWAGTWVEVGDNNSYAFKASVTTTLVAAGTSEKLEFNAPSIDEGGAFTLQNSDTEWLCNVAGLYDLEAHIRFQSSNASNQAFHGIDVRINGTIVESIWGARDNTNTGDDLVASGGTLLRLAVGDVVTFTNVSGIYTIDPSGSITDRRFSATRIAK
jgi:plastocyanin